MAALALVWAASPLQATVAAPLPDVLLVTLDTTRADALGAYGAVGARTPTLDGLAAGGVRYASAWSPAPLTLPAHATLFTGLDPAEHGLRDNGWGRLPVALPALADELHQAGYRTAGFVGSRVLDRRFGLDRGFDTYDDVMTAERYGQYGEPERPASEVVDAALAWLAKTPSPRVAPLFVWAHVYDPHAPYDPPDGAGGTDRERYAGEVANVDRELARLLTGWPPGRPRIVAVVGDHGEAFGEHGETGHGLFLYRTTLEVPLLLTGSGVPQGRAVRQPVATRRLAATLLALLGLPARLPGPALPLTDDTSSASPIFHETQFPASAYGWSPLAAVTLEATRAVAWPQAELYDLASDPGESRDLAARPSRPQREVLRLLSQRLKSRPPAVTPPAIDAETAATLHSLGYLTGSGGHGGVRDPRTGAPLLTTFDDAGALLERGEANQAVDALTRLVAASPESVPFLARLAAAQSTAGRPSDALATLDRALRLSPLADQLHLARAQALRDLGRLADAATAFRTVLELNPREAAATLGLGEMALRGGAAEEEERLLAASVAAGTQSAIVLARLGEIALGRGQLDDADRRLAEATRLLPEWPAAWALWAEVASRQGSPALAAERRRRASQVP